MARSNSDLVFIDATAHDLQLTAYVAPEAEVMILTAEQDGIEQITTALTGRSGLQILHIVSFSGSGSLQLGSTQLTLFNLDQYGWQLQQWGESLVPGAEIVFYDFVGSAEAVTSQFSAPFLSRLRLLTGANIALMNRQELVLPRPVVL
ncbi:MAG: DUF4347 domain-containing protein [Elainella sp.]